MISKAASVGIKASSSLPCSAPPQQRKIEYCHKEVCGVCSVNFFLSLMCSMAKCPLLFSVDSRARTLYSKDVCPHSGASDTTHCWVK